MPKNVMKLLKPSPHRQRNDFDLSHRHVFDANFGELLPATCIETVPGDNITLHASDLLRAIPFVSSPFLRAKQHIDVWYVPYHDLWHNFDAFMTEKHEPVSSAFGGSDYLPHMSAYALYDSINYYSNNVGYVDIIGRPFADRSYYLLQLLGYGDIENKHGLADSGSTKNSLRFNPFRLAAYNYIWYNEYRQQYYDDGTAGLVGSQSPALLFNFDDLQCDTEANAFLTPNSTQSARLASMCQMRYRCWKKDLFTGILPSTQFGVVSTISFNLNGTVPISGSASLSATTGTDFNNHYIRTIDNDTHIDYDKATLSSSEIPYMRHGLNNQGGGVVTLRENRGHFYGIMNEGSTLGSPLTDGGSLYFSVPELQDKVVYDAHTHNVSGTASLSTTGSFNAGSSFDVLALRKAEAVQIWRENALRAGNHIKDNMIAHYGVASDFNDHRPTYLGSVSAPLNIGDIATTANSGSGINDTVGDIAGKGISSLDEKVFKFHAKDFGVIMVMFSMLPEAEYDASGVDRANQLLESEDFFIPEYENLGLEAVSVINISATRSGIPTENRVLGYAPRYFGYKTKLDKVFGAFVGNGVFRSWSSQRTDVSTFYQSADPPLTPLSFMYVNPALYDANFNVGIQNSPQFLVDIYFDVDAVRPMSVIGLPFS